MENIIRVAADSQPSTVAGAIAAFVRQHQRAEVQAIGARAVNQMMKAATIARRYLEEDGLSLTLRPSFVLVEIHGQERTAVRLHIRGCPCGAPLDLNEEFIAQARRRSPQPIG